MKRVISGLAALLAFGVLAGVTAAQATVPASEFKPKTVKIAADQMPLRSVLEKLQAQTGFQFGLRNAALLDKPVKFDGKEMTQWEALQSALGQVDSTPTFQWTFRRVGAATGNGIGGRLSASGPFLVVLNRIGRKAGIQDDARVILTVQVLGDAAIFDSLSAARMESTPAVAVDEQGHSLVWTGILNNALKAQAIPLVSIVLQQPPATSKKIAKVEGVIPVTVATLETFEIAPGQKKENHYGKMNITVECSAVGPRTQAIARFIPDADMTDADLTLWKGQLETARVAILNTEGQAMLLSGKNTGSRDRDRSLTVLDTLRVARGNAPGATGTPGKAVLVVPTSFKRTDVPYAFKDLDLP